VRGFRVEPGEIEVLLAQCPGVRQIAVVPKQNGAGRYLAAYVAPLPQSELSAAALRRHARTRLPDYMIPSHFMLMPELPLTANGKIDRDALPTLDVPVEGAGPAFVAPHSDAEKLVAAIWRDVLQQDRLSVDDNFFDVGGHSLLLIKVLERLRTEVSAELSVLDLFRFPTIATLAGELANRTAHVALRRDPPPSTRTGAIINDRAALLRRALSRQRPDARIPPEAAS
jgi:hypothetical protein